MWAFPIWPYTSMMWRSLAISLHLSGSWVAYLWRQADTSAAWCNMTKPKNSIVMMSMNSCCNCVHQSVNGNISNMVANPVISVSIIDKYVVNFSYVVCWASLSPRFSSVTTAVAAYAMNHNPLSTYRIVSPAITSSSACMTRYTRWPMSSSPDMANTTWA